jgi:hypothetical protein
MNKESLKIPNEWTKKVWKYQMNEQGKFENTKWMNKESLKILNKWTRKVWKYQMNEQGKFENTKWMKKESLKIPNELSEKVSRRRTVNTMAKRNQYNGRQYTTQKARDWSTCPSFKTGSGRYTVEPHCISVIQQVLD